MRGMRSERSRKVRITMRIYSWVGLHDELLRPLPPGTNRSAPNYESGGQELESPRSRHLIS